ncbi:hypothetical protein P9743_02585, partial [Anoxybacillus geothermalis]|nr:hypothetical protein [Anoxybacillus geothermalis]
TKGAESASFVLSLFHFPSVHQARWKSSSERACKRSERMCKIRNNPQKFCTLFPNPPEII